MQDLLARSLLDVLLLALGWLAHRLATRIPRSRMPRMPKATAADLERTTCLIDERLVRRASGDPPARAGPLAAS